MIMITGIRILGENKQDGSQVAGTTVARSSSVLVVAHSIPSQFPPLLKQREAIGHHAGCQEVSRCSTCGGSRGIYITFNSVM